MSTGNPAAIQRPAIPPARHRNYRYGLQVEGNTPPWRPDSVFDDGRRVYVVFPRGIVQDEMPPLFALAPDRITAPASPYVLQAGSVIPAPSSPAFALTSPPRSSLK